VPASAAGESVTLVIRQRAQRLGSAQPRRVDVGEVDPPLRPVGVARVDAEPLDRPGIALPDGDSAVLVA
jgi:hypothetical protein